MRDWHAGQRPGLAARAAGIGFARLRLGALLVARKNLSSSTQLRDATTSLAQAGAVLVGSVINEG